MRFGFGLVILASGCKGGGLLEFTNANNYEFSNTILMEPVQVGAGADVAFDWSGLTVDLRQRDVDPATIEQISLLKFSYPFDELVPLFELNEIDAQSEATESYLFDNVNGVTSANATDFEITGVVFDPALFTEDPESTWTMSAVNYPGGRLDLLMSQPIQPREDSDVHEVTLENGDTDLTYSVDMHSSPPIQAKAGADSYGLDWSGVTKDVYGHPFNPVAGDELLIGHFDGSVSDVEAEFLQLDSVATEIYRMSSIGVTELDDLSPAIDDAGNSFGGFTTDGTWLVAISCTSCSTPVPLLLAVVEVE